MKKLLLLLLNFCFLNSKGLPPTDEIQNYESDQELKELCDKIFKSRKFTCNQQDYNLENSSKRYKVDENNELNQDDNDLSFLHENNSIEVMHKSIDESFIINCHEKILDIKKNKNHKNKLYFITLDNENYKIITIWEVEYTLTKFHIITKNRNGDELEKPIIILPRPHAKVKPIHEIENLTEVRNAVLDLDDNGIKLNIF